MKYRIHSSTLTVLAGLATLMLSPAARADFIFSLQTPITANPNTTGNVFDVLLTNTGTSATIAAFSFGINTTDTDITFTGADTTTSVATYIFAGDSFDDINSFPLNTVPPPAGQTLDASDLSNSGLGTVVGTGVTVAVGRIFFDVANGAAFGPATVSFDTTNPGVTSLSDTDFNSVPFSTLPGAITITSSTTPVPEPASVGLLVCALTGFAIVKLRRRRAS